MERTKNCLIKLERINKALNHEEPDQVPISDFFWGNFIKRWKKDLNLPDDAKFAYQVIRGHGINGKNDGFIYKNLIANYTHMRNTGSNNWIERFLAFIAANK